jgi:hypothetical protein
MNRILLISFCAIALFAGVATGGSFDELVTDAFLKSPEIIQAQSEAKRDGYEIGEIQVIGYSGLCGAVGCQSRWLVIQGFSYKGTNPRSMSLMSLVGIGPKGNITSVKRVVLADFEESKAKI